MPGIFLCWLVAAAALLAGCATPQTSVQAPTPPVTSTRSPLPPEIVWTAGVAREPYEALVNRVKVRDAIVDFREMRAAYAELPLDRRLERLRSGSLQREMFEAFQRQEHDRALERAQALLGLCYVDIDAHMVSSMAYRQHGDLERANYHRWIADGLIRSILDSGDGRSPETAMEVISVGEEYALFRVLGLQPKMQSLKMQAGHAFDAMQLVDPQTKEAFTWYFNVDVSMREMGEAMQLKAK